MKRANVWLSVGWLLLKLLVFVLLMNSGRSAFIYQNFDTSR